MKRPPVFVRSTDLKRILAAAKAAEVQVVVEFDRDGTVRVIPHEGAAPAEPDEIMRKIEAMRL